MAKARWSKFRSVIRKMGAKSIAASVLVFLITVAVTCMAGFQFYRTTKENIRLQGHERPSVQAGGHGETEGCSGRTDCTL